MSFPEDMDFDLSEMSEDEKNAAILLLADKYNGAMTAAATMFNAMQILSSRAEDQNQFGQRSKVIKDLAYRMRLIAHLQLPVMGIDLEQMQADLEFERLTAQLEEDDE